MAVTGKMVNDKSVAQVGGTLNVQGGLENIKAIEPTITTEKGRYRWMYIGWNKTKTKHKRKKKSWQNYAPAPIIVRTERDVVLGGNTPTKYNPDVKAAAGAVDWNGSAPDGLDQMGVIDGDIPGAIEGLPGVAVDRPVGFEPVNQGATVSLDGLNLNMYTINPSSTSNYLVETNPRLTNYRVWLSSDFMLARMNLDPTVAHIEIDGMKVFPHNNLFDPSFVFDGKTNLEWMQLGRAPIGYDGHKVVLHHLIQTNDSALVEISQTLHQQATKTIHIYPNSTPSKINRSEFRKIREDYWMTKWCRQ